MGGIGSAMNIDELVKIKEHIAKNMEQGKTRVILIDLGSVGFARKAAGIQGNNCVAETVPYWAGNDRTAQK